MALVYRDKHTLNESVLLIIMIHITCFHFSWTAVNVSKELTWTVGLIGNLEGLPKMAEE